MKKTKVVTMLMLASMLAVPCSMNGTVQAQVNDSIVSEQGTLDVRLGDIVVGTDYNKDEVTLSRQVTGTTTKVTVVERTSGDVLEVLTERDDESDSVTTKKAAKSTAIAMSASTKTFNKIVTRTKKAGPCEAALEIQMSVYSSGSFRQINKVLGTKMYASGSSDTTLEDKSAYAISSTGKFPCVDLDYSGSGVITGSATSSTGASFSVSALEQIGFEISNETSKTWYFRKPIKITGSYSLY